MEKVGEKEGFLRKVVDCKEAYCRRLPGPLRRNFLEGGCL